VKREKTAMSEESVDQIMMTEDGKLRNTKGNIVILKENKTSLLVNQQKKKEQKLKDVLRKQKQLKEAINERGKYYDRNLSVSLFGNTGKRQKHKVLIVPEFVDPRP
jgi:U4/U6 small nuclear ribonucleoprotein PRP3